MAVYNPKTRKELKREQQPELTTKPEVKKSKGLFDYEGHELISERIVENMKVGITGVERIDDQNIERAVEYASKLQGKEVQIKKKQVRGSYRVKQDGIKIVHGEEAEEINREVFNEENPNHAQGSHI